MSIEFLFFLSSGLFLGWASGANYMGKIFGTAIGTKMISFAFAALVFSIFIVLGAVYGGGGTSATIEKLGYIDTMSGAFTAALVAAISMFLMTKAGIPVSSTQAIVGGIIGWNIFFYKPVDMTVLFQILGSWVASPVLSGIIAMLLMLAVRKFLKTFPLPLLYQDVLVRLALVLTGAFGAYSLGANNIGNIVGVFISASDLSAVTLFDGISISGERQLFLLGGLAIAAGAITYSKRVINTIGKNIFELSPVTAWVVVMAHSLVMFLFASEGLHAFLSAHHLPAFPLVPISSSEAVIGAIVGIALLKKGRGLKLAPLGKIAMGWLACPLLAMIISFTCLTLINLKVNG